MPSAARAAAPSASAPLNVFRWLQAADWLHCDHEEDQAAAGGRCAPAKGEFNLLIIDLST